MYMYMNKTAQNMHAYKLKKFGSKQAVCLHSLDPNKRFIVTPYIYTKTQQGVNISWRKNRVGERGGREGWETSNILVVLSGLLLKNQTHCQT